MKPEIELALMRLLNIPVVALTRALDVCVLWVRPRLLRAYFALWLQELFRSPYKWPRSFESVRRIKASGQARRELLYGEAPAFTAAWLLWREGLGGGGALLDIGAGRGRPLLGAALVGGHARGLELLEEHVRIAAPILKRAGVTLEAADALTADLGAPTHVLLNWCGFAEETRSKLATRLASLPAGTRILAVTVPLDEARFPLLRRRRGLFTWGTEPVFVHEIKTPSPTGRGSRQS